MYVHSFIRAISIAPLQVRYYSEALPTQHRYCAGISRRTHDPPVERRPMWWRTHIHVYAYIWVWAWVMCMYVWQYVCKYPSK